MRRTRYIVEWTPWAEVEAAAIRRGMPKGGEVGDYVDPVDFERFDICGSFPVAVAHARKVLPTDTWKCPRIRRQVIVPNDHDDLGNRVEAMPSYETEATWEVFEGDPDPVESAPDWIDAA